MWTTRPMLSGEDPEDLTSCLMQVGLSADDLAAFSEEIRRVVTLCGMALGSRPDDDDNAEREAAKALLRLVSRISHAVLNLRG